MQTILYIVTKSDLGGIQKYLLEIARNLPEDINDYDIPIIVTATYYYEDIKKELLDLGYKYIYSLSADVSTHDCFL